MLSPSIAFNFITFCFIAAAAFAQSPAPTQTQLAELKKLSIEELAATDITGSGRRPERLDQVASAVTVITSDDLRRYGVMTLPDALRLADTLHVAQVAGAGYAISIRGFNITTANKLLVMIDGRTVYSPVFSGVFWEAQDLVIADIERIEVVRGPGGTVWGANAVNGVIHVITKNAADTRGTLVNAAIGTDGRGPFAIRHGGRFGAAGSYRVYGKVRFDDAATLLSGGSAGNAHDFGQAGFRIESDRSGNNFLVVQGDVFEGRSDLGQNVDRSITWRGANLMTRWTHRSDNGAETIAQAYYDHFYRRVPVQYRGVLHTLDVDVQHQRTLPRTTLVVGGGYRNYRGDDLGDGPGFFFEPRERVSHRSNLFGQAEVRVTNNLFLTGGIKVEHNEFTGAEAQPSASARWTAGTQTLWASFGRSVRVPTRFDTDLRFRVPNSDRIALTGSADFRSESVKAYEAGYRRRFGSRVSVDLAGFENRYDHLRSQEVPVPPIPIRLMNMMNAVTRGAEVSAKADVASWWQVGGGYAYLWKRVTFDPGSTDRTGGAPEGNDPRHIVKLRSHIDIGDRIELDAFYRHIGALPAPVVAGYTEVDVRLGYRVRSGWELALVGTNLLHDNHLEFRGGTPPQVYERGVTLRSTWRF
ncbi:MAG TPA: TonB-dependent receptor [Vicinamibacterales bacterium]|nr:TonB-dependent receptor [Vicinamibacterales bacterium]